MTAQPEEKETFIFSRNKKGFGGETSSGKSGTSSAGHSVFVLDLYPIPF